MSKGYKELGHIIKDPDYLTALFGYFAESTMLNTRLLNGLFEKSAHNPISLSLYKKIGLGKNWSEFEFMLWVFR
jgi:hypothetical protein